MNKLSQFIKLSLITMLVMLFIVAGQVNVFANPISWTNQYEADVLPQNATPAWERNVLGTSYILHSRSFIPMIILKPLILLGFKAVLT